MNDTYASVVHLNQEDVIDSAEVCFSASSLPVQYHSQH